MTNLYYYQSLPIVNLQLKFTRLRFGLVLKTIRANPTLFIPA